DAADRIIRTLAVGFAVVRQQECQPNFHGVPSAFFGTAPTQAPALYEMASSHSTLLDCSSTSTQRSSCTLRRIASPSAFARWPSANVGKTGSRPEVCPPARIYSYTARASAVWLSAKPSACP